MHYVKDWRTDILLLPLIDTAVTKPTQQISAANSVTEVRGIIHLTPHFLVAKAISISEQWQCRTVDEIMKFLSFLSHGGNTNTVFFTCSASRHMHYYHHFLFLKYNSLFEQTNPNEMGEGPTCEVRGITIRDVFKYKYLLQQIFINQHPPYI